MTRDALLVTNDTAGSVNDEVVTQVAEILREGYALQVAHTDTPQALADALAAMRGDHVVVAGGDGSLHLLLNTLADLGRLDTVAVGVVPLGTGNDFAAGIGLPDNPQDAARACLEATPQPVDVVVADDGEYVVNAAHAGIGAVATQRAQPAKPALGPLAYPLGAIQAGLSETGYRVAVEIDGATVHQGDMLLTLVANGPCIGGGARLCAGADPTDGTLDVVVIDSVPLHERPGLGVAIQRGTLDQRDDVSTWQGGRVRIAGVPVDHNRDGEIREQLTDVTYTVRPSAWHLLR